MNDNPFLELLLMRHAKSDWDAAFEADRDRPLNQRGRSAAETMGLAIASADKVPDRVVTSPAVRAVTTAELAISAGGWQTECEVDEAIYSDGPDGVIEAVRRHGRGTKRLMVVGHQPTMSTVVSRLIGGGSVRFPTAAIAGLLLTVGDGDAIAGSHAELQFLLTPKLLASGTG